VRSGDILLFNGWYNNEGVRKIKKFCEEATLEHPVYSLKAIAIETVFPVSTPLLKRRSEVRNYSIKMKIESVRESRNFWRS
jgi:hypothetical protein